MKDFERAPARPPFPELDGTDPEMGILPSTPNAREAGHVPPPETARDEPWFFRAAEISARAGLVFGVAQFLSVAGCATGGWAGAGAPRTLIGSACLLLGVSLASPAILLLADIARGIRRHGPETRRTG
jgi:hypothetical protein